jgi:hypothetical protein
LKNLKRDLKKLLNLKNFFFLRFKKKKKTFKITYLLNFINQILVKFKVKKKKLFFLTLRFFKKFGFFKKKNLNKFSENSK